MPRSYIPAFPDIRGQRYERTLISETQSSPLDTAGDVHGQSGNIITRADGTLVNATPRRYRFRVGWDVLTTEQAVDIEHAVVTLGANGVGVPIPFIEWEISQATDDDRFYLWPGNMPVADPWVAPFQWWEWSAVQFFSSDTGSPVLPMTDVTFTADPTWIGNVPTFSVAQSSFDGVSPGDLAHATVTGRRIRMVTVEKNSYTRDKARASGLWSISVTLTEKESGIAPGVAR